jgi:hypothetical protein
MVEDSSKTIDFLFWLTGIVVLTFVGISAYSLITDKITFEAFSGAVGTTSGLLIGFWVKNGR